MNSIKIIRFNDDIHAEKMWVNGIYIGDLSDINSLLFEFMTICNKAEPDYLDSTLVYACDDFEDDLDEQLVDVILDWFYDVEEMTEPAINAIFKKDWVELYILIMKQGGL